ncbi:AI-2E family transporter [Priestia taiwanensis]|uniref:AI-2E family transporter n=1 Tax=Priestia taiwanensis TaxID=1347902 RepID=A0A917ATK6_9BACI|nr:AI-2E family transporter [Priestia taiwanensis]MBM7364326.1 putative PurR-regulated permease PerM [Priestia taiwanensis]GGE73519.1 AI-2E family transporter [Priestia taiwanensis]
MFQSKFFRACYGILLVFLIVYLGTKIDFIFKPIVVLFNTIFFPLLIAGVLYYLFRPIVFFLEKKKIPRTLSILLIYIGAAALFTLLIITVFPILWKQITDLINQIPAFADEITFMVKDVMDSKWFMEVQQTSAFNLDSIISTATGYATEFLKGITTNITGFIGVVTNVVMIFVTVPIVLFYLLKEGEKAPVNLLRFLPKNRRENGRAILTQMDDTISSYIQGQVLVSTCVGTLLLIGYWIIGIEYALLLAIAAMLTNVIPYLGPILATIPALFVALADDNSMMVVYVLIVMTVAQQIESNFISPQIMGNKLEMHPITIIFIILAAGSLAGVLGVILAVPFYAIMKVLVSNIYRLIMLRYPEEK